jgi:alpha-ketoglutarate-dependent taurine dioxygenase
LTSLGFRTYHPVVQAVPLGETLGAELVDFDITSRPSSNDQVELRRLFRHYHLLLVRGQPLTATDHDRFVACFGPLQSNRVGDDAGYVTNREHPRSLFGPDLQQPLWHLDGAYGPRPGIATSLWAEVVSPEAPPTLFANAVRGLRCMPPDLRSTAEQYRIQNIKDTAYDRTADRHPRGAVETASWLFDTVCTVAVNGRDTERAGGNPGP